MIRDTYSTLQNLQTYYQIGDVDVDRYLIDGKVRQVLIAARGLNSADLPSQSFVNRHIVYTHGYGVVASPSNSAEAGGDPNFLLRDVPVKENGIKMDSGPPSEIYFAENLSSYVLTGAEQAEFNYQKAGATDQFTRYKGKDGVKLSNFVRRAAFALRFGSLDPLISGQINSNTKLLMERDIRARVTKLAPFLEFDADPYPVVLGEQDRVGHGRLHDDRHVPVRPVARQRGLARRATFNYVRNSVKVTVDAYQGTVNFYVFDKKDPIIKAYEAAFPDLFTDGSRMPEAIRDAPALPRGPVQVAGGDVRPLPRDRAEALLRRQRQVAGVARPRFGSGVAEPAVGGERDRRRRHVGVEQQPAAGRVVERRAHRSLLPQHPIARTRHQEHFIVTVPFVPVSSGNSSDAPGVVPHRELRSRAVREDQVVHDAAGSDRARARAGEQPDHPHRDDLHRDHVARTSRDRR